MKLAVTLVDLAVAPVNENLFAVGATAVAVYSWADVRPSVHLSRSPSATVYACACVRACVIENTHVGRASCLLLSVQSELCTRLITALRCRLNFIVEIFSIVVSHC